MKSTYVRITFTVFSELVKRLSGTGRLDHFEHIEANSLAERTALSHGDNISNSAVTEARRAVHRHVLVTLLISTILRHEVQVVAANDNSALHLGLYNHTGQDSAADGNIAGPWTLLVDVRPFDSLTGSLEA